MWAASCGTLVDVRDREALLRGLGRGAAAEDRLLLYGVLDAGQLRGVIPELEKLLK
jgi:hypothetical protein